jgi:hypothetical protein
MLPYSAQQSTSLQITKSGYNTGDFDNAVDTWALHNQPEMNLVHEPV